jgi:hypothetical protein
MHRRTDLVARSLLSLSLSLSLTARLATATEIEQWLARRNGQQPKGQQQNEAEQTEIVLGQYV